VTSHCTDALCKMDETSFNVAPPAYDDEMMPAGATASPQSVLSFFDHKEKVSYGPSIVRMMREVDTNTTTVTSSAST